MLAIKLPAPRKLDRIERIIARTILLAGPARAIRAVSLFGFLKL